MISCGSLARPLVVALVVVLALAAGCRHVPGPAEVQASRERAYAAAFARAQARFGGAEITTTRVALEPPGRYGPPEPEDAPPTPGPERLAVRVTGQGDGDVLYRLPDGRLALSGPTCLRGGSCGCSIAIAYRYLRRDDGAVAVVRLTPDVETIEVEVDSCGFGCGVPPEPVPLTAALVPVTAPEQLTVIDERYRHVEVVETCAHPIPAP